MLSVTSSLEIISLNKTKRVVLLIWNRARALVQMTLLNANANIRVSSIFKSIKFCQSFIYILLCVCEHQRLWGVCAYAVVVLLLFLLCVGEFGSSVHTPIIIVNLSSPRMCEQGVFSSYNTDAMAFYL